MSDSPVGRNRRMRTFRDRWIGLAVGMATLLHLGIASAEVVARKPSESDDGFMARVLGPSADLAQKVVRSTEMAGGKLTLIGFVNHRDSSDDGSQGGNVLVGHLLIESSPDQYEHVVFPSCDEEGDAPTLLAVFFARTVKGGGRDLAVLCRWKPGGMCYGAEFYRVSAGPSKTTVESVKTLKERLFTCDQSEPDGQGARVGGHAIKFRTVAEVKKLLTKIGLKQ
jgi:hypothetical protein